tara:strand:- start:9 stop:362 length:354 start_codon:yes stop_codon:yes gene_type:complete
MSKFNPAFKALISEAAAKCFGNRPIVPYRTGFKYLLQKPTGPTAVHYYPKDAVPHFKKASSDFRTDEEERREETYMRLKRRGKGPPKKGEGTYAVLKKCIKIHRSSSNFLKNKHLLL